MRLAPPPRPGAGPGRAARPTPPPGDLERIAGSLLAELVYFRGQWWPEQLARVEAGTRARRRPVLLAGAGAVLAVALALGSAAAALRWPAYGRFVARAAQLSAPPAPDAPR